MVRTRVALRRLWGAFVLLVGIALLSWVPYNLFVRSTPEAEASGGKPQAAIVIGALFVLQGLAWMRR